LLLVLTGAPLVRAAMSVHASQSHECCPGGAAPVDDSQPCQFAAPFVCCGQTAVPETPTALAAPLTVLVPFSALVTLAPPELPRLTEPGFAPDRVPIPPLLKHSVLLL
jgi:hypothetical protein